MARRAPTTAQKKLKDPKRKRKKRLKRDRPCGVEMPERIAKRKRRRRPKRKSCWWGRWWARRAG